MRVLITGSRNGHPDVERWLDAWVERHGVPDLFVLGDARGMDEQARRHCALRGWPYERHFAHWRAHRQLAGPERNRRMVETCQAGDACLAFPSGESRGTRDCMRQAMAKGLVVHEAKAAE